MHHNPATTARGRVPARAAALATWSLAVLLGAASAVGAPPSAPRQPGSVARTRAIVDPAVVPAGGVPCQQCGRVGCPLHQGHLAECRDGLCAPHCPVRPGEYGFYRTQWRRWPGQGVVPASAEEAATPARPPMSQVPTIEEESPRLPSAAPVPPDGTLPSDPIPEDPAATEPVDPAEPVSAGAMRYPAQVGRSLAAGAAPWRLEPAARQRPDDSDRGL